RLPVSGWPGGARPGLQPYRPRRRPRPGLVARGGAAEEARPERRTHGRGRRPRPGRVAPPEGAAPADPAAALRPRRGVGLAPLRPSGPFRGTGKMRNRPLSPPLRLWLVALLLAVAASGCRRAAGPVAPPDLKHLDHLLRLMKQRLALMHDVARWKWQAGQP